MASAVVERSELLILSRRLLFRSVRLSRISVVVVAAGLVTGFVVVGGVGVGVGKEVVAVVAAAAAALGVGVRRSRTRRGGRRH